jgi:hypothetical protein
MTTAFLSISRLERRFATGNVEELSFEPGVNVLVGRPNTGKTKWLQTLDFLLGDPGGNPFEGLKRKVWPRNMMLPQPRSGSPRTAFGLSAAGGSRAARERSTSTV